VTVWPDITNRAFHPELVHVIQAMETGIRSEVDMHKAIEAMQINEVRLEAHYRQGYRQGLPELLTRAVSGGVRI
jgi:hypothetical protein